MFGIGLMAGCSGSPVAVKLYPGDRRPPAQVAELIATDDVRLLLIDQHELPAGTGGGPGARFELLAGNHRIRIARRGGSAGGTGAFVQDFVVDLVAGNRYTFVTQSKSIGTDFQWECQVANASSLAPVGRRVALDPALNVSKAKSSHGGTIDD